MFQVYRFIFREPRRVFGEAAASAIGGEAEHSESTDPVKAGADTYSGGQLDHLQSQGGRASHSQF